MTVRMAAMSRPVRVTGERTGVRLTPSQWRPPAIFVLLGSSGSASASQSISTSFFSHYITAARPLADQRVVRASATLSVSAPVSPASPGSPPAVEARRALGNVLHASLLPVRAAAGVCLGALTATNDAAARLVLGPAAASTRGDASARAAAAREAGARFAPALAASRRTAALLLSGAVAPPSSASSLSLVEAVGPVAAVSASASSSVFLLLTRAVASFMKLYLLLLFCRVLLSWFPQFDWERQPWLTLRQLTDPYLNLFRGLVPPLLGQVDLTPLLGFWLLQYLAGMLDVGRFEDEW